MAETTVEDVVKLTEHEQLVFWCAGCESKHVIPIGDQKVHWEWNQDKIKPTVDPSILIYGVEGYQPRCHFFIKAGNMQYLADCEHKLRGHTIFMTALELVH